MKEKFLAGLKNAAVIIIASLMLLGVIPLGMISHISTVNAEGDFLRLYPEMETSISAEIQGKAEDLFFIPEDAHAIGGNHYGYLRFDLNGLSRQKANKIKDASLRLVFLKTPAKEVPVRLWMMEENGWSKSMKWENKPSRLGEVPITTLHLSSAEVGEPRLAEVDLTNYVKKWVEEGKEKVSFRVDGLLDGVSAVYAGSSYQDPVYRPCLKVVTGNAEDPDADTLQKVSLEETYATSMGETDTAIVGDGEEVYLKFSLHPETIQGSVCRANLFLRSRDKDPEAVLRIERLGKSEETAEQLKQNGIPRENRTLLYREEDSPYPPEDGISLAGEINRAYTRGETEIALVIRSENGKMSLDLGGTRKPRMEIEVSDRRNAMAVMETAAALLGENERPGEITESLTNDRIAENGIRTMVSWSAVDQKTGKPAGDTLAASGKIYRPKWFQNNREIIAKAVISAGNYKTEEVLYLTVTPQEIPDFEDTEFQTMLDIGTGSREKIGKTESIGTVARSRWVDGRNLTYREIGSEGMLVLHLATDPEKQNYFTVKLWEEDEFPGLRVLSLQDRSLKPFQVTETTMAEKEENGFSYLTYPIPLSYTRGREYISLCLTMAETEESKPNPQAENASVTAEDAPEAMEDSEEKPTVSVYAAYVTQSPYFDPMFFAEQGEPVIKKDEDQRTIYRFLQKIYNAAEQTFDFRDVSNPEEALPVTEESGVYTNAEEQERTTLVFGKEEQLMLELPETGSIAKIYRNTSYYNAYAETAIKEYHDGTLQIVEYGTYRIFRNRNRRPLAIPWQEASMAGLYRNLADSTYYSFLQKGQKNDDSILPDGTEIAEGATLLLEPGETLAMVLEAEPLRDFDFKVSEISGQAVADVKLTDPLDIHSLTLRAMGTVPDAEEKLVILCGVYDRGMLVGLKQQQLTVSPGQVAAEILLQEPFSLQPGQTLKIFVERQAAECKAMTPVLELPQKQANEKK